MSISDILRTASFSLGANRLRSALALLGIVLGIGSVIVLISLARGFSQEIRESIQSFGTNLLFVSANRNGQLTMDDVQALRNHGDAPAVSLVAPQISDFGSVIYQDNQQNASIYGVSPEYMSARNIKLRSGLFISKPHLDARAQVAVLSDRLANELFGSRNPVGAYVRLQGQRYRVIGVMQPRSAGFEAFNLEALIPITTALARIDNRFSISGQSLIDTIYVQLDDTADTDEAIAQVETVLRISHRLDTRDDFRVDSQQEALQALEEADRAALFLLGAIGSVSLLVGGIGIMNIMLVSVTERTREIGIRQAMGAKTRDILAQFVAEAVFLTFAGGIIGVILGYLFAQVLGNAQNFRTVVSWDIVLIALAVASGIGLFFGIYPASRAAAMKPIDALKYE